MTQTAKTTGSAGLDRMIRRGFRFSPDATISKKDDVAGISRVKIGQTLRVEDVTDPNAKARAIAAGDGGQVSIAGEVSDSISPLDAALFYAETAGATVSDEDLADVAIGAANRNRVRADALEFNAQQDLLRETLEAQTRERLAALPVLKAEEIRAEPATA